MPDDDGRVLETGETYTCVSCSGDTMNIKIEGKWDGDWVSVKFNGNDPGWVNTANIVSAAKMGS